MLWRLGQAFSLLDGTADGAGLRVWHWIAGEDGVEGVAEIVGGGGGAAVAEIYIGVVDASAVGHFAAGCQDDGLGGDFGAQAGDQLSLIVQQDGAGVAEFAGVGLGVGG